MNTRGWFLYNGAVGTGAESNINNFSYVTFQPGCSGGDRLGAIWGIYTPIPYGVKPNPSTFSSGKMHIYITNAKATGNPYPSSGQPYALSCSY